MCRCAAEIRISRSSKFPLLLDSAESWESKNLNITLCKQMLLNSMLNKLWLFVPGSLLQKSDKTSKCNPNPWVKMRILSWLRTRTGPLSDTCSYTLWKSLIDTRNVAQRWHSGNKEWSKTLSVGRKLVVGMIIASSRPQLALVTNKSP